jgi:hypothetical protein
MRDRVRRAGPRRWPPGLARRRWRRGRSKARPVNQRETRFPLPFDRPAKDPLGIAFGVIASASSRQCRIGGLPL